MLDLFITKAYAVTVTFPGAIQPFVNVPFDTLVGNVIKTLLLIAGILATIFLIVAGIQYITAGGDATKATAARTAIVNAIIGIIIILIAFSITSWVTGAITLGKPG
ncbi:MAG: hypothetical protein Q7S37_03895 [bacterium]|nr:hypothetical protein [bacterium]